MESSESEDEQEFNEIQESLLNRSGTNISKTQSVGGNLDDTNLTEFQASKEKLRKNQKHLGLAVDILNINLCHKIEMEK